MVVAAALDRQEPVTAASLRVLSSLSYRHGELDGYLQTLVEGLSDCIGADWVVITFQQPGSDSILASSLEANNLQISQALSPFLQQTYRHRGRGLWLIDAPSHCRASLPEGYLTGVGIQLRSAQGTIIGTLCLFNHTAQPIAREVLQAAQAFADRAASAIDSYLLYQRQQRFNQVLADELDGGQDFISGLSSGHAGEPEGLSQLFHLLSPSCHAAITDVEATLAKLTVATPLTTTARVLVQQGLENLLQVKQCMRDIRHLYQDVMDSGHRH